MRARLSRGGVEGIHDTLAYSDSYVWVWAAHTHYSATKDVLNPFLASSHVEKAESFEGAILLFFLSEEVGTLSDVMARPKTHNSTADQISRRVETSAPDTVFHAGQFLDLDTRTAVDKALSRLVQSGCLRRLARGLYCQPRAHPVLGDILPPVESVARALADRDHVKLQPFGGYAANLLRLSEQVPARVVFLTDGKPRKIRYGKQTIELRRAMPRMMAAAGRTTGLLIAGLRFIGKPNVTPKRVAHLRHLLSAEDRRQLLQDIRLAPAWMHRHFRVIAQEEKMP